MLSRLAVTNIPNDEAKFFGEYCAGGGHAADYRSRLFAQKELSYPESAKRREAMHRVAPALEHISSNYYVPSDYLVRWRVRMAAAALSLQAQDKCTDMIAITELAYRCDFSAISGFNRHFGKVTVLSPSDFRRSKM